ncbi:MAG: C4-dicarboxylate ABC transporter [Rhodobacterales bacterium]|nr:C4-dicarboxylate ABC transporter [Rhodobacterales bacterium]
MNFPLRKKIFTGLTAAAVSLCVSVGGASAQVELVSSDTVNPSNDRAKLLTSVFGTCLGDGFDFKPYHGATLFKQGTELNAMQRGNLDMAPVAIPDLYNQVPESSILSAAYLYRDYDHMRKVWASGVLDDLLATIQEKARIKVLTNVYIGTRQVNLKGDKVIKTPADLAGVKLRMPGGEVWQFIGEALGANPTPVAFTEVYTALQTGAVDGQDNPFTGTKVMKFYEVTDQIVLTNHLVANNLFSIAQSTWDKLDASQQAKVQECAIKYRDAWEAIVSEQDSSLRSFFEDEGLKVYDPDREAFQSHVQQKYMESKYADDWPKGLVEKINAVK